MVSGVPVELWREFSAAISTNATSGPRQTSADECRACCTGITAFFEWGVTQTQTTVADSQNNRGLGVLTYYVNFPGLLQGPGTASHDTAFGHLPILLQIVPSFSPSGDRRKS